MSGDSQTLLERVIPSITSGLVIGILEVGLAISFAALVFSGSLAPYVPYAIGYALAGAAISGVVIALLTSLPGMIGGNQDAPAAILALMAAGIVAAMPPSATAENQFLTVAAAVALTTSLTGLFLLATGTFHLGGLARFLPYPVVGGFLAGTGWLLVTGAVTLMANLAPPQGLASVPALLQPDVLIRWLPGLLLALLILLLMKRFDHYLLLPGLLILSLPVFFAVAWLAGADVQQLSAGGWLLGPFSGDGLWRPLTPGDLSQVSWPAVLRQAPSIVVIMLISTVSLLLNASGMELAVKEDIDLDRELRAAGTANFLVGLAAGLVTFQQLAFSVLTHKSKAATRLTGVIAAAVCVLALFAGAGLLALFPKIIIGALLLLLGLSFILEWVVDGWSRLPRIDYAIVVIILLVTAVVGFLQAVALGLLLAVVIFVVGYSQVDVVRSELTAETYQSRVVRSRNEEKLLQRYGSEILILQLHGFLFFGTADSLLKRVRERFGRQDLPLPAVLVLNFEQVTGLDTTALMSFSNLRSLARKRGCILLFCGAREAVRRQLVRGGLGKDEATVRYFDSLDEGMAWSEELLLGRRREAADSATDEPASLEVLLTAILDGDGTPNAYDETVVHALAAYFEPLELPAETVILAQGAPAGSLYFLVSGRVTARLNMPDGSTVRLETMGSGRVVGELAFFLGGERTAEVLTDAPSVLYRLRREDLQRMEESNPFAAALLHRLMANLLAERVMHLTAIVRTLEE